MNVDHVYSMQHFVQPGETLQSGAYNIYCGGKGLNQSVAAARAGAKTKTVRMEYSSTKITKKMKRSEGRNE